MQEQATSSIAASSLPSSSERSSSSALHAEVKGGLFLIFVFSLIFLWWDLLEIEFCCVAVSVTFFSALFRWVQCGFFE